jgi:2-polyprenyl-3-methyl-5-hydroxy-6-metoxy-1,4-benzoquinol methylase
LPIDERRQMMDAVGAGCSRYTLKADPHSSHSVILGWLGDGQGRRLLDVGAADGLLSRHLTARGWKVTGLEADPAAAAAGAAHCERMVVADLDEAIPDLDGRFDAIVCGDVLEHLAQPARALRALAAALAPGGAAVVSVPNVAHLWMRLSLLAGRFEYAERGILDRTHLRFFTERSLRALVGEAGLAVTRATVTPLPLYQVVPERYHGAALAAVHGASAAAARALPRLLGYQFVVQAVPA